MQTGIDLAREPDRTVCIPILIDGVEGIPLRSCISCVWFTSNMEECDDPNGGTRCKCFAPSSEAMEQARVLVGKLQMAYWLHLSGRPGKRLPWLETAINELCQFIENRRP